MLYIAKGDKCSMGTSLRVAHLSVFRYSPGVQRQLAFEQRAAQRLRHRVQWEVHTFLAESPFKGDFPFHPTFVTSPIVPRELRIWVARWSLFRWLRKNRRSYDFILLRWPGVCPLTLLNHDLFDAVLTVHHTKEIEELHSLGLKGRAIVQTRFAPSLLRRTRGIVGVTREIINYEAQRIGVVKPDFLYPNGIDYETVPLVQTRTSERVPVLLMVASRFFPWHGLDLIYQLFHNYKGEFVFHIVGDVPPELRRQITRDKRFNLHGVLNTAQIVELAQKSHVGISSMALFRKQMEEASPIKTREYLAFGLPVIGGYGDAGLPEDFPFYVRFDLRKGLDAEEVLDIAKRLSQYAPRRIREESRPFVEKIALMQRLLADLHRLL